MLLIDDARLTLEEVSGPLKDLNDKLCGPNAEQWLKNLKRFLRKEKIYIFKKWRTVKFNVSEVHDDLRKMIENKKCYVDASTKKLIKSAEENSKIFWKDDIKLDIVIIPLSELGFIKNASSREIEIQSTKVGLGYITSVVQTIALRLNYPDQPQNEKVHVMLNNIVLRNEAPARLYLARGNSNCALLSSSNLNELYTPTDLFAFILPED